MKSAPKPPDDASRACAGPTDAGRAGAESGAAEWTGSMVRGLAALEFLERSSDLASEAVVAAATQAELGRETDSPQPQVA
jgi:hypothetical protein